MTRAEIDPLLQQTYNRNAFAIGAEYQRQYNYYQSLYAETVALAPRSLVMVRFVRFFKLRCAWRQHCVALGLGVPPFGRFEVVEA